MDGKVESSSCRNLGEMKMRDDVYDGFGGSVMLVGTHGFTTVTTLQLFMKVNKNYNHFQRTIFSCHCPTLVPNRWRISLKLIIQFYSVSILKNKTAIKWYL